MDISLPVEFERLTPGQQPSPGRVARRNRRAIPTTHTKSMGEHTKFSDWSQKMVLFCDQSENSEYFTDRKWLPDARPSALAPAWGLAEIAVLRRGVGVEWWGG